METLDTRKLQYQTHIIHNIVGKKHAEPYKHIYNHIYMYTIVYICIHIYIGVCSSDSWVVMAIWSQILRWNERTSGVRRSHRHLRESQMLRDPRDEAMSWMSLDNSLMIFVNFHFTTISSILIVSLRDGFFLGFTRLIQAPRQWKSAAWQPESSGGVVREAVFRRGRMSLGTGGAFHRGRCRSQRVFRRNLGCWSQRCCEMQSILRERQSGRGQISTSGSGRKLVNTWPGERNIINLSMRNQSRCP